MNCLLTFQYEILKPQKKINFFELTQVNLCDLRPDPLAKSTPNPGLITMIISLKSYFSQQYL